MSTEAVAKETAPNEVIPCDVTTLKGGDVISYYTHENGKFFVEKGTLKEDNIYSEGVEVHGEGWKQYVSKWFICKVKRNGEVIFNNEQEG